MFARLIASKAALSVAGAAAGVALLGGVALGALGGVIPSSPVGAMPQTGSAGTLADRGRPDRLAEILDKLVKAGVITADQRDKILKAIAEAHQRDREGEHRLRAILGNLLEDSAKIIAISVDDLKKELPGKSVAQVAEKHGVSRNTLVAKLTADVNAAIDKALAEGKITQEQAEKAKAKAPEAINRFVDHVFKERDHGRRGDARGFLGNSLQNVASAMGISLDDLKKELPGKSVAQVAEKHGVSRDMLVAKLTASATSQIDKALADGKLTADQAAALKARLADAIGKLVDTVHKAR